MTLDGGNAPDSLKMKGIGKELLNYCKITTHNLRKYSQDYYLHPVSLTLDRLI
jgi:hypothetical protein